VSQYCSISFGADRPSIGKHRECDPGRASGRSLLSRFTLRGSQKKHGQQYPEAHTLWPKYAEPCALILLLRAEDVASIASISGSRLFENDL
jgi:hypothetical protein